MMVGGLVIHKWKLHEGVSEAARFHHDIEDELPLIVNHEHLLCIVTLANHFCGLSPPTRRPGRGWL